MIYAFNERGTMDAIEGSAVKKAHDLLEAVGSWDKLTAKQKKQVLDCFGELWHPDAFRTGRHRLMGMIIDFGKWMKTFYVEERHNGIHRVRSFSKMAIRKNSSNPSWIIKIVEVPA